MKNTRIFLSVLLALTLAFSTVALSACSIFGGENDGPIIGGGGEKDSYSVSFSAGADDAIGTAPEAQTCESGSRIKLPDNPFTREGYTFKGWSDGSKTYSAGANYTVAKDVTFTAVWEGLDADAPDAVELASKFYDASSWTYMTNNNGASLDGGDVPYSMTDGSIKFHKANQAIEMGDMTNATVSFMLKATNDFSIWFNSSSIDNANNSSYRLAYAYGGLRLVLSSAPDQAAALISEEFYKKADWNRFDIVFSTVDNVTEIKVYINGIRAALTSGDYTAPSVNVADDTFIHTQPAMFKTGNYMVVKVWEAHNYVQLKPVAKAEVEDLPIIACIGASITEGAGAGDGAQFYTLSYPAQLQNALNGEYNVINYGNSGKTVRDDLGEESWLNTYQWQGVQAIVPDIAILNIGTNDSKTHHSPNHDAFYASFKNLVDKLLLVNPDMEIIVCTVPYAYSSIWEINNDNIANIIAPVQREIAAEYGFTLVDLYEYTQNKPHLFPDGVHPNAKGYEMIVKILKKALTQGEEALTEEFINAIHEEYKPLVANAYVTLESLVINDMKLTITGKTNDPGLKFYVGQEPGNSALYNFYGDITRADDDSFSYAFDLTTMPVGTGWYNVRLYHTDGNYYAVSYEDLVDGEGASIGLWSNIYLETTQIQISSWNDGSIATLSFNVQAYVKPTKTVTVTGGSAVMADGKIILTVNGTTDDSSLTLLVGPSDDIGLYGHAITVNSDGSFTVTFDLATLENVGAWHNVKIFMSDGNSVAVPYDKLGLSKNDEFILDNKRIVVNTWGSDNILSLSVENYDPNYFLTGGKVSKDNVPVTLTQEGDKVYYTFNGNFNGSANTERTFELVLTVEDPAEFPTSLDESKILYTASNVYSGDSNTQFTFKINATDDIGIQSGWIRLVLKVTEGDTVSYYTIKPIVPGHTGDWYACADVITLNGVKYEMAICWSSFFFQVIAG